MGVMLMHLVKASFQTKVFQCFIKKIQATPSIITTMIYCVNYHTCHRCIASFNSVEK